MENSASHVAVLAEKPSVARDIARVLGAQKPGAGFLQGNGYVVTWAIGHLVSLAQPHEINPAWKRWSRDTLPMLPGQWPLSVYEKTKDQFDIVRKILLSPRVSKIVCATDAGREGELIFRYIYEAADCEKPVERLWISSLTPEAIRRGFENLRPATDYLPLANAASGRSRADWLVGMNLSRAYSIACNEELSVGRVQTPTLAMVVERELTIRNFIPENYLEVHATFHPRGSADDIVYQGVWFRTPVSGDDARKDDPKSNRLDANGEEANAIAERVTSGRAQIASIDSQNQRILPPQLYDLTELQRHANRLFGFSAQTTLDLAQALYERHKLISYPRTDSRYLSQDVAQTLGRVVAAIGSTYKVSLPAGAGERPLGRRFVDDARVSDHHAIIPNPVAARGKLSADESKVYDLICRRLLSAWGDDYIVAVTTIITAVASEKNTDLFRTSGSAVQQVGWKALDYVTEKKATPTQGVTEDTEPTLPSGLTVGQGQDIRDVQQLKRKTRAPKRFSEGTLLTAMETAGKTLDEKELSDAMKETGLGTPATRASIIETLLKRGYVTRTGKNLDATEKGIHLIEVVHPEVKSPVMTGQWEAFLRRIQNGNAHLDAFLEGIETYVRSAVEKAERLPPSVEPATAPRNGSMHGPVQSSVDSQPLARTFEDGLPLVHLLEKAFAFPSFRPNQEEVCQAVVEGRDVLLVMPTGAGKSLCYQLPGIARGGTTLVVSPLIALMEDQTAKLKALGFAADRIHSGRDRSASRQACLDYLAGKLQFLFIAPERLRVSGFAEMLAKRKPSLIAIDEAHCISQWGHDFRPDYRMLGQYLPLLRPAPVIALTATATRVVQRDINLQLQLTEAASFVHGFRRDNIALEIVEARPSERVLLVEKVLSDSARRPAIVYTPTRKQAVEIASALATRYPSAAYHAGLDAEHRGRVQEAFLAGTIEVMVATVAFGMGIDKPNIRTVIHTALPGTLEGYYQEIGRAGRDGEPSRALLMQSYADRHTHDFFLERDYPDVAVLDRIFARLDDTPIPKTELRRQLRIDADLFDKALEKLWTHTGAQVDFAENIKRGKADWRESYVGQNNQRSAQIELVLRFASSNSCRMAALIRHFGDLTDAERVCGVCDFCAPAATIAKRYRAATAEEQGTLVRVVETLRSSGRKATGRLHADLFPSGQVSRDNFEDILGAMAQAGLLQQRDEIFEKDGKRIPYRTVALTPAGQQLDGSSPVELMMKDSEAAPARSVSKRGRSRHAKGDRAARSKTSNENKVAVEAAGLENALRTWRLQEAKRRSVPAFRIFTDQVLRSLVADLPRSTSELIAVSGVGPSTVKQYGEQICRVVNKHAV